MQEGGNTDAQSGIPSGQILFLLHLMNRDIIPILRRSILYATKLPMKHSEQDGQHSSSLKREFEPLARGKPSGEHR